MLVWVHPRFTNVEAEAQQHRGPGLDLREHCSLLQASLCVAPSTAGILSRSKNHILSES